MQTAQGQRGAAMVEFIVGAVFVLVPMMLAVQALGKFADVQNTAHSAARYAAWEKTVWFEDTSSLFHTHNRPNQKSAAQIRNETLVRVINDRRSGLKYASTDKGATTFARGSDPLWQDNDDHAFLEDPNRVVQVSSRQKPASDVIGTVLGAFQAITVPNITGTLAPPVPVDTMAMTTVRLDKLAAESAVYKRLWSKAQGLPTDWLGLDMESRSGVLSNTWSANARSGTTAMVSSSVPTAQALGDVIQLGAQATMLAWDPSVAPRLDMGKIAPDVVPGDRLK